MDLKEKTLSGKRVFDGRVIKVRVDEVMLPNGNTSTREVIEHNGGVCVAALTDEGEVLLVRQYRYPYGDVILEIPAGKRDITGESPLQCGMRELKEETGATAETFYPLGELYPSPGYCGEVIWMFAAKGLTFGEQHTDEDEFLSVEKIPLDTLVDMIMDGKIADAKTQTAILKLKLLVERGEF